MELHKNSYFRLITYRVVIKLHSVRQKWWSRELNNYNISLFKLYY